MVCYEMGGRGGCGPEIHAFLTEIFSNTCIVSYSLALRYAVTILLSGNYTFVFRDLIALDGHVLRISLVYHVTMYLNFDSQSRKTDLQ